MKQKLFLLACIVLSVSLTVSCGKKKGSDEKKTGTMKVDPATVGTVSGKVMFEGVAPKGEPVKMNADPKCMAAHTTPVMNMPVMVNANKTLKNVFVYVKRGAESYSFNAPDVPAEINQEGCEYHPHVQGMMVGQKLLIKNSDPTLHNIHARPTVAGNSEFNVGQPVQGMTTTKTFDKMEIMVPFRCDVHNWMNAFVGVCDNPFFATTGDDGSFSLKGLPPGTYTIGFWHEKLGAMEQSVTIAAKESKEANVTYKGQ